MSGVLGIDEHIPRYGLWVTTDPRCQAAVTGLVAESYDFKLVYKWGCRPRETRLASQYLVDVAPGGLIHEAERRWDSSKPDWFTSRDAGPRAVGNADYIREVFIADPPGLVRHVPVPVGAVPRVVGVSPGDVIETVDGVKVFDSKKVRKGEE